MDHNPSPPFLLREAGLYVDETPKHQVALPVIDNHAIVDSETGMRIHLSLNGIFSCFPRCALTLEEIKDQEDYPIIFSKTPGDANARDPYTSHFAEIEAVMLDGNGLIVEHSTGMPMRPTFVSYMVNWSYGTSSMT